MIDFSLYLITDRHRTANRPLPEVVAAALAGGVRTVQLREKDLPPAELYDLAWELRELTARFDARLLINDRIDVALAVEADGVHLGINSLPVTAARRIAPDLLIGYSSHGVGEAAAALAKGADFVTFGPVFPTPSKAAFGEPKGCAELARACATLHGPVFALGGVTLDNLDHVTATGCHRVAVIGAILEAPDPAAAAEAFRRGLI
ncbi:thiamine phosphate synthase [Trichlorobacter ammonificans]|uniref:Thiamine-phosphate synthase n=1 Tax=Trichlorobacter ammonificans TaxID=2916410 RepID=A0ABM9D610_9BACT|nr:thiamine phosphate synthase [Trichlorobacter ammonificans]CAH2029860.1 Putative thiamine-phosphate synthase [Trichlorobacter ammonificans]